MNNKQLQNTTRCRTRLCKEAQGKESNRHCFSKPSPTIGTSYSVDIRSLWYTEDNRSNSKIMNPAQLLTPSTKDLAKKRCAHFLSQKLFTSISTVLYMSSFQQKIQQVIQKAKKIPKRKSNHQKYSLINTDATIW